MTGFLLTPERHAELADLLGDEKRFRTSYPKVAEYLDTAPRLPGTGDDDADRAFDLRLVHYMTGGESDNPYWDIVAPSAGLPIAAQSGRRVDGGRPSGSARLGFAQTVLQEAYAYAIPSPETLAWVDRVRDSRGLLEVGAGRGYWAGQLRRLGVDVLAYDSEPPDQVDNVSFRGGAVWGHVGDLDELAAARAEGVESDRVLFLCWPPGWGDPMALEALESYERAGGDRLIYIGEPRGGKTGTDAFFDKLATEWNLEDEDAQFVAWWNLQDHAQCWSRRR
ncbi:hypothetical protein SAMN04244553_6162 [Nocardia amikacinitolerans]|uniref:Methyltransferase domain-containing protein n=1 Tax=Nocardia amikacinitolerans TaxID=756689 RepID=A0A285LW48_9NOCA|nr:hypothetical protein [Nocardia amikacinitolerans]SNY89159.1 hypothetical protein SAMN04244553_6162 [Nocardia amikacinitolerans]